MGVLLSAMDLTWSDPSFDDGACVTVVVTVTDWVSSSLALGLTKVGGREVEILLQEALTEDGVFALTLLHFQVELDGQDVRLCQGSGADFFTHCLPKLDSCLCFREACSGLGAVGACQAGFRLIAQNDLQVKTAAVAQGISGVPSTVGDISHLETVVSLWQSSPGQAGLAAGVSCQPYSRLGDSKGPLDSRARSMPAVLLAGHLYQAPWILLECVTQAGQHPYVQDLLATFAKECGYTVSQVDLELSQVWVASRSRWWCLLLRGNYGRCHLHAWKAHGPWHKVGDVFKCPQVSPEELGQLLLTQFEVQEFEARRPLASFLLQSNRALPTALHAWGCQVYPCPCECRKFPFKSSRLDERICAVLLQTQEEGSPMRHLSAREVAYLNGLSPTLDFGSDARLALCLVGQLASPLQSAWILAQLRLHFVKVHAVDQEIPTPLQVLMQQKCALLADARRVGFLAADGPHCVEESAACHSGKRKSHEASSPCSSSGCLPSPSSICPSLSCTRDLVTVENLTAPQRTRLHGPPCPVTSNVGPSSVALQPEGSDLAPPSQVGSVLPTTGFDVGQASVDFGIMPFVVPGKCAVWQLAQLFGETLGRPAWRVTFQGCVLAWHGVLAPQQTVCIEVAMPSAGQCPVQVPGNWAEWIYPTMSGRSRVDILACQYPWVADDQMMFGLLSLARGVLFSEVIDPLAAAWVLQGHSFDSSLCARISSARWIFTAILCEQHWIVCAWELSLVNVRAWCSASDSRHEKIIAEMQWAIGRALRRPLGQFRFERSPFRDPGIGFRGHLALLDLEALLHGLVWPELLTVPSRALDFTSAFHAHIASAERVRAPFLVGGGIDARNKACPPCCVRRVCHLMLLVNEPLTLCVVWVLEESRRHLLPQASGRS